MYKLLNFYSLISDPTGILEKSSPENCLSDGGRSPSEPLCRVIFENEQEDPTTPTNKPSSGLGAGGRRRSLVSSEPQHVTLIVFGIGMVNRTHLEADIGGLTMEAELKKIHGSFTLKEKMKGNLKSYHIQLGGTFGYKSNANLPTLRPGIRLSRSGSSVWTTTQDNGSDPSRRPKTTAPQKGQTARSSGQAP
ncbi:unnamed protein product [Oncorhynchus mykiss]|uniref:Bridge-like lipid transfer protein family member 1 middle region domain-containing protein n=1 Tax=Oncorhynchus mykiss TaxID=8022 RepID=A0A060VT28_ONCMY|nr:unnamed protein product [Oncorhynchus mykiss]